MRLKCGSPSLVALLHLAFLAVDKRLDFSLFLIDVVLIDRESSFTASHHFSWTEMAAIKFISLHVVAALGLLEVPADLISAHLRWIQLLVTPEG